MRDAPMPESGQFSAEVRMELRAGGETFSLSSIGPNELILREACDIAICDAEIVMRVDGEEFRWSIHLPGRAVPFSEEVFFEPLGRMVRANISDNPTGLRILPSSCSEIMSKFSSKKRPGSNSVEPGRPDHRVMYRSISRGRGRSLSCA